MDDREQFVVRELDHAHGDASGEHLDLFLDLRRREVRNHVAEFARLELDLFHRDRPRPQVAVVHGLVYGLSRRALRRRRHELLHGSEGFFHDRGAVAGGRFGGILLGVVNRLDDQLSRGGLDGDEILQPDKPERQHVELLQEDDHLGVAVLLHLDGG